jgi:hypothetical protein
VRVVYDLRWLRELDEMLASDHGGADNSNNTELQNLGYTTQQACMRAYSDKFT